MKLKLLESIFVHFSSQEVNHVPHKPLHPQCHHSIRLIS